MVYFLQAGEDGPIVIGYARDRSELCTDLIMYRTWKGPRPEVRVRATIPGDYATGTAIRKLFRDAAMQGDWFGWLRPTPELLAFITEVSDPDPDPVIARLLGAAA
jgi:hypothetical protein